MMQDSSSKPLSFWIAMFLPFSLLWILMFVGLVFLAIGWRMNMLGVSVFGGIFILLSIIATRSGLPSKGLLGACSGMLLGALGGALLGSVLGDAMNAPLGIVGGAILGAISGIFVVLIMLHFSLGIGLHLITHFLPKLPGIIGFILFIPLGLGAVVGAVVGAIELREVLPRALGAAFGTAVVGGTLGMVTGTLLGIRLTYITENVS